MSSKRTALAAACLALAATLALPMAASRASPADKSAPSNQLGLTLAPIEKAHTFAQVRRGGSVRTLFVISLAHDKVTAVDLSELAALDGVDAFDVIKRFSAAQLDAIARQPQRLHTYPIDGLIGVGPRGLAQIAAGTNYPAHGEEVGVDGTFLFPKLSAASGPRSAVAAAPGALMDYEVEVCARFDRELRSLSDFDEARKGLFICGDFSDRATLVRNLNLKNILSGDGFPDAKSGPDRFPAGPFLVVPKDWKAFMNELVIETWVDGDRRQHVRAADMIKDLRAIVNETLDEGATRTWAYQGGRIPMLDRTAIATDSAVLTGTGDGVIFQQPAPEVLKELMQASGRAQQLVVIEKYLAGEVAQRKYLQPGNQVTYTSNYLGAIHSRVVAPGRPKK
ncbi:MAG TPA: fumarylacetoacetate hydrolase family protein [Telluria sp.]|jgi:2-keto-4-pentenoate hydratase/2-oxohepta-3-ene-1,7-dioic acid hydratase in catechol pathway